MLPLESRSRRTRAVLNRSAASPWIPAFMAWRSRPGGPGSSVRQLGQGTGAPELRSRVKPPGPGLDHGRVHVAADLGEGVEVRVMISLASSTPGRQRRASPKASMP